MPTICEQSSLVIPNDAGYAPLVGRFASDIAAQFDFNSPETDNIASAVESAVRALLAYSFAPAEKGQLSIEFERVAEGLQIRLRDKGLPFDIDTRDGEASSIAHGLPLEELRAHLDEVYLNNHGREGKEVVLVKHLKTQSVEAYFDACLLKPFESPPAKDLGQQVTVPCQVRQLKPEEAAEVSKIIYRTYGYNYPTDTVYFPEKIAAMNESGRIHSAVAISADDQLVGHCALQFMPRMSRIAEMSQGAVVPGYRGKGCFGNLTRYLLKVARSQSMAGIYSQTVTTHTHSQHTALQMGFKDCGIMLGLIPAEAVFRGFGKSPGERSAMVLQFLDLEMPAAPKVYLPDHHHRVVSRIYSSLGIQPVMSDRSSANADTSTQNTEYDIEIHPGLSYAVIHLNRYGHDTVALLTTELKRLRQQKTDIIHLRLPLNDSQTIRMTVTMEKTGFFFAGILPGALQNSDALILQYLNNVPVDYGKIKVISKVGEELVDYIKRLDPNL